MCACNGTKTTTPEPEFVVTYTDGRPQETVVGEHAAKVKVTMAGNGTYRQK